MDANNDATRQRWFRKRWLLWAFVLLWTGIGLWQTHKTMPAGTDVNATPVAVDAADVQFLSDLTYANPQAQRVQEQQIFDEVFRIIDAADSFIVADFFLFNDFGGANAQATRNLSSQLAGHLIARQKLQPGISILVVTDPINNLYSDESSALLQQMRNAGINVVVTDLDQLRDSNPAYSALWRMFGQWWSSPSSGGAMPNPFDTEPAHISFGSWLRLLNFKANHRKLIAADRDDGQLVALVTSANPHDASSAHSNVALRFTGKPALDIVHSELGIARFSGWQGHILAAAPDTPPVDPQNAVQLSFLTEESIGTQLLGALDATRNGDSIRIATFYLADRKVIASLLAAAKRGVSVQLILDPNRDAFGRQKDGVPNRPVANELVTASDNRIQVRWYRTHGEQFHTKLALITHSDRLIASLGSANLTRRNLGNYNLEANVAVEMSSTSPLAFSMSNYFNRLWTNEGPPGTEYTADFGVYRDTDNSRYWRYRLMEATGLGTF